MTNPEHRGQALSGRPIVCITPTYRRHAFLPAAYESFDAQTHPRKAWVVIDSSPEPEPFLSRLADPRVVYVHVPHRARLAETVPPHLLDLCRAHVLESAGELVERVRALQERECDRIRMPDLDRPTIGEARNLAAAIGRRLFATDDQVVISHKDDDDYYHPRYLETVAHAMLEADWVKLKSFLVHIAGARDGRRYGRYDYDRRDEPVLLIEDGREYALDRYVVYRDAGDSAPAEWGQAAFFGLLFNYTYAALQAAGGFFPLNRAEDIHLYRGLLRPRRPVARAPRLAFLDAPAELVCRIQHTRSQRTLVHDFVEDEEIPDLVREGVARCVAGGAAARVKSARPRVLLTNDDGVLSEGMRALYVALSERFQVQVVAPMDEQSGVGHSVSLRAALGHRPLPPGLGLEGVALSGTPVDCVKCALAGVFGPRPDLVVAGINDGENTGVTIYNSGTASAAREAAIHGLPAFSVSLARGAPGPIEAYASRAAELIGELLEVGAPAGVFYNLNLPACAPEELTRVRVTRLDLRSFADEWVRSPSAGGQATVRLRGGDRPREVSLDYDSAAVAAGFVSLTPVSVDATHAGLLAQLAGAYAQQAPAHIRSAR
jgi:5'-nucleotidase